MKILVTGGAGYIGSHAARRLADHGHLPIVFDNLSTGHRSLARFGPLVVGDVTDRGAVDEAIRRHEPQAIVHFAALSQIGEAARLPERYFRTNVAGTANLAEAAAAHGVEAIVFSSTAAVYGDPVRQPIREDDPTRPINAYGDSKLAAERLLAYAAAAHGLTVTALRYFNAAGADAGGAIGEAHDPETHVIPLLLQTAAGVRETFSLYGDDYDTADGTCVRDYLHVTDLADAHVAALTARSGAGFEAINLGTSRGASIREMIAAAEAATGRAIPVTRAPRRTGDPATLIADAGKAATLLGWKPQHSDLDTIMRTAWNWLRNPANPARI